MSRGSAIVLTRRRLLGRLVGLARRTALARSPRAPGRQERVQRALGEDDVVADQHVVGVELVGDEQVHLGDVAQAQPADARRRARARPARCARLGDACAARPAPPWSTGVSPSTKAVDDVHAAVAGPVGQGTAQGGGLHLLGGALAVVARRRAVDDATAGELRRADRALTGAAGALLLVRLAAAAADLAAGLGVVRALPGRGQLGHDDLVDQRDVDLDVEDLGGQLDRAGLRARRRRCTSTSSLMAHRPSWLAPSPRCGRARARPWGRGRHP